jgi:hypothetical protein
MKLVACFVSVFIGLMALAAIFLVLASPQGVIAAMSSNDAGIWITYTVADGLPANNVWGGVAVDDDGQIWAGFENGDYSYPLPTNTLIARLNGSSWLTYDLPGCRVWPLVAEREVYAGTYCPGPPSNAGGGLSWFIDGAWINFTSVDGIRGMYLSAIAPEGNNHVWIASGDFLYWHPYAELLDHKGTSDKADDEWKLYDFTMYSVTNILSIAIDPQGKRWFGTNNGVWVLSADGFLWVNYPAILFQNASVSDIAFDSVGNVWFATGQRVVRFNGTNWTYYNSREKAIETNFAAIMTSYNRNRLNSIYLPGLWAVEDRAGVWIINADPGGYMTGASFYNGSQWITYTSQNSGLGDDDLRGLSIDRQQSIWFGTRDAGLSKYTPIPKISVEIKPSALLVELNQSIKVNTLVDRLRGWVPSVTLEITGLTSGITADFSSHVVSPPANITLTITTMTNTSPGIYPLTATAIGNTGMTSTAQVTIVVASEVHRYYWPIVMRGN